MRSCIHIFAIILTSQFSILGQTVDSIVQSIGQANRLECSILGYGGEDSELYTKFEKLEKRASKDQLAELLEHDSKIVVVYAAYALIDNELISPANLMTKLIDEDDTIPTVCGCIGDEERITSLIYMRYWNSRVDVYLENGEYVDIVNDNKEFLTLDSLVLRNDNLFPLIISQALENRIYEQEYDQIINAWAFEKGFLDAIHYVYKNRQVGNELKIKTALKKKLESDEDYGFRINLINEMLANLN